jgi:uncharacterized membrane protein
MVPSSLARTVIRFLLGGFMALAGVSHFTAVDSFAAQVPPWMPFPEAVIYISGVIEIALALGLWFAPKQVRPMVGWALAAFYVVIFPGNISQYLTGTPAFGLDSDAARFIRLLFQPVLIVVALWCTGAWASYRSSRKP